jgi:hypothetical protein
MKIRLIQLSKVVTLLLTLLASTTATAECTAEPWLATISYSRGSIVTHNYHEWHAKRTTREGVAPGTHKPTWADKGACEEPVDPPVDPPDPPAGNPMQVFGVWHAGDHYADWSQPIDIAQFDKDNGWLVRGAGGSPSVNLVVLSFLQPMDVLLRTTDEHPEYGVPEGMTEAIVDYFKGAGIRVMMSIGGQTYVDFWDEALATDAMQLGLNAAKIASKFGVGIEIDYEQNLNPDLKGLDLFIEAYRSIHAYNPVDPIPEAVLTVDLAAGGRYLQDLNRHATENWLHGTASWLKLDYANAMVHRASGTPAHWQEHVDGMPTYDPPIPPKSPGKFTGGLYLKGNIANCKDFHSSEQLEHADYVQTVVPNGAGTTAGMLGYMFWAAGVPSARKNYTDTGFPNTCEDGMGDAAIFFGIEVP